MRDTFTGKERLAMNEEEKAGGDPYGDKKWETKLAEKSRNRADELLEYFKKPEVHEKVAALAIQYNQVFGFEWFTLNQCSEIFKSASVEQVVDITRSLQLCGFLISNTKKKVERFRLSKNQFKRLVDALRE